ncbi:MAG: pyrimidine 5'-nucleotidase [Anaerolineales bacterium]|nr:pyrimidine 5'-nucleotidase [Anaerolineales bacterium]
MLFDTLLIDLDDTLYERGNGLWEAIRERMSLYMHEVLGFSQEEVPALRRRYFETYGTTLRGLQIHHHVDADEYLAYVHDLPLTRYLQPDPSLRQLLLSLPQSKHIFTNADANHARRVLGVLGVEGCFDSIIDIRALDFFCKPEEEAYLRALRLARVSDRPRCVYLDDAPSNLAPARRLGVFTVLVGKEAPDGSADLSIRSLKTLPQALPELWVDGNGPRNA